MIFKQKKYYFNPVTLAYEEIQKHQGSKVLRYSVLILSFLLLAFISGYLLHEEFGAGETRKLQARVDSLTFTMQQLYERGTQYSNELKSEIFPSDNTYRLILGLDTLPYPMRNAGRGGSAVYNEMAMQNNLQYQLRNLITSLKDQLQIQSNSYNILFNKAISYSEAKAHMPAIQPVDRNDLIMIASEFGVRNDPFLSIRKQHHGLDFVTASGKNVYATGDGIVTFSQHSRNGYGNEILIDHDFGFGTRYAHLGSIKVQKGQKVKRGQIIGTVGSTGRATGPHLHYEVLYNNQPVNPSYYFDTTLTRDEFAQIINRANGND